MIIPTGVRFPVLVSCACFLVSFGLARWTFTPVSTVSKGAAIAAASGAVDSTAPPAMPLDQELNNRSARERLGHALRGDDPLASAARIVAWLDASTLEDFQSLAEKPEEFPSPEFSGLNADFRAAFFEAIAERWLDLDPENGIRGLEKLQKAIHHYFGLPEILTAAARVRPEAVLNTLSLTDRRGYLEYHTSEALRTLAGRSPEAARRFLDRFETPDSRRRAEVEIARGIVSNNPLAAISLVQQLDANFLYQDALSAAERIGPGMVRQLVSAAGGKLDDHPELPRLLLRYPDLAADITNPGKGSSTHVIPEDLLHTADRLDSAERQRLLDSYDTLPAGTREAVAAAVACSWARTEPAKAAGWAMAHAQPDDPGSSANQAANGVFLRWVNNDPKAAQDWWSTLPPSPLRDALGTNASTYIAEQGDLDTALKMFRPRGGEADETIATQLTQYLAERDPAEAADWLKSVPPETGLEKAAHVVITEWYPRDPEAVARWVESLPAGPKRDGALTAFVNEALKHSPEGATEWVETIADPKLRQKAAVNVYWGIRRSDPAMAESWLRTLTGVDPEWQARFLRRR